MKLCRAFVMRLRGLCIRSRAAGVGFLPRNPGPSPGIQMGFQAHLWLLVIVCGLKSLSATSACTTESCEEDDAALVQTAKLRKDDGHQGIYRDPSKCNIFTLWEKDEEGKDVALMPRLVLETWRRHTRGLCNDPVLISDENVRELVPDLPEEYFRLPYSAAKSDFLRYGMLYHHGGIFIDFDMVAMDDMDDIVGMAHTLDLLSYSPHDEKCNDFSSNFLGGRRGSPFFKKVWEEQKSALTNHCQAADRRRQKVCCFEDPKLQCHIPWGGLGERLSHKVFLRERPSSAFCFTGPESFTPNFFAYALEWKPHLEDAQAVFREKNIPAALDRKVYHLFNALMHWKTYSCAALFKEGTLIGRIMSKTFTVGRGNQTSSEASSRDFLKAHPEFVEVSRHHLAPDGRHLPCVAAQIG